MFRTDFSPIFARRITHSVQKMRSALAFALLLALSSPASAFMRTLCPGLDQSVQTDSTAPRYEMFFSPHTHHWNWSPEHRQSYLIGLSRLLPNDRFCGFSLFRNSFGQPAAAAFVGKTWPHLWQSAPRVYASVSMGIMYGYVGRFQDNVPLNVGGFSPVIIPAIGYRLSPQSALEIHLLGVAGFMLGASWRF